MRMRMVLKQKQKYGHGNPGKHGHKHYHVSKVKEVLAHPPATWAAYKNLPGGLWKIVE